MKLAVMKNLVTNSKKIFKNGKSFAKNNAPAIATAASIICWTGALVTTAIKAPKMHEIIKDKKERDPEASKLELAAAAAPVMAAPAALAIGGAAMEIFSLKMSNARVAAAMSLAATAMADKNAVLEAAKDIVGEEKVDEIREKVTEKHLEKEGKSIVKDDGQLPFADDEMRPAIFGLTGQTFTSSPAKIKIGIEDAVDILASEDSITLEDLVECLGANEKMGRMKSCAITGNLSYNLWEHEGHGNPREKARDMLDYELKPWTDENGRLGWYVDMKYRPNHYTKA